MAHFTIIKSGVQRYIATKFDTVNYELVNGEQVEKKITAESKLESILLDGETFLSGPYPVSQFKIVEGKPVELTDQEKEARQPLKKANAKTLFYELSEDLAVAGVSTTSTLPPQARWLKQDAINAINQAAGRARSRGVSQGNLLVMEYERLIIQVNDWIANGRDSAVVPGMLNSYSTHSGMTATNAADYIVAASDAYDTLLANTYDKRHQGTAAVNAATEDFAVVAQTYIENLDAL
jgi:hypothetical protein